MRKSLPWTRLRSMIASLVPASRALVDRFLAEVDREPDAEIGRLPQFERVVTVELAAINAAMAGCRPEYFPVVLAAWEALMRERAATGGGWQSTSGPAPLIVVNGPVRERLGFNRAGGAFGPGFRANATVARAVGLIVRNVFGVHPHVLESPRRWPTELLLVGFRRGYPRVLPCGVIHALNRRTGKARSKAATIRIRVRSLRISRRCFATPT